MLKNSMNIMKTSRILVCVKGGKEINLQILLKE